MGGEEVLNRCCPFDLYRNLRQTVDGRNVGCQSLNSSDKYRVRLRRTIKQVSNPPYWFSYCQRRSRISRLHLRYFRHIVITHETYEWSLSTMIMFRVPVMAGETGSLPPGWGGRQPEGIFFLPTTTYTTLAYSETIPSAVSELGYTH